jgi:hypothetical protein
VAVTPARFRELVMRVARTLPCDVFSDAPMLVESTLRHSAMREGDAPPAEFLVSMGRCAVLWGGRVQESSDALTAALLRLPQFRVGFDPVASAVGGCVERARARISN